MTNNNYPSALMNHLITSCDTSVDCIQAQSHHHNVISCKVLYAMFSDEPVDVIIKKLNISRSSFFYYRRKYSEWYQYDATFRRRADETNDFAKSILIKHV